MQRRHEGLNREVHLSEGKESMTRFADDLPINLERKEPVAGQPSDNRFVAKVAIVTSTPNRNVCRATAVPVGFKSLVRLLILSVVAAGSPALAARSLRYDADWRSCEQSSPGCRASSFEACAFKTDCTTRTFRRKPMQDDSWPANMNLGAAVIRPAA